MHILTQRNLLRLLHILLGLGLGALVYMPPSWTGDLRGFMAWVGVPLATASRLAMWQQGRIRRWLATRSG